MLVLLTKFELSFNTDMIVKYCLSDLLLMIALIVGAAIVFVVIVAVILYFVCRRKETEQKPQEGSLPYKGNMF